MNMQTYVKKNSRKTNQTKTLLFVNTQAYTERSDGLYLQQNKTDSLTFLSLIVKFASKNAEKSIAPGDSWVQFQFNLILILTRTNINFTVLEKEKKG